MTMFEEEEEHLHDQILTAYETGDTYRAIAERVGLSKSRVHEIVKDAAEFGIVNIESIKTRRARQGVPVKSRNAYRDAKIVLMRQNGARYIDIAKEMNMNRGTVQSVCHRYFEASP